MLKQDEILSRILYAVNRTSPDAEVYLYGSRARGEARHLSDWDILILLNLQKLPFELETKFINELYEVELDTGEIISPLVYTLNEWNLNYSATPLYENIKKEGVRLQ